MDLLKRLQTMDIGGKPVRNAQDAQLLAEWRQSGVKFAASSARLENVYYAAFSKLLHCIVPYGDELVLQEGGAYAGCWLESTGTINAEVLSRFLPSVSESTFRLFARFQRADGLMPYKVTGAGPAYRQIQLVTPLARSVWNHYRFHNAGVSFLEEMYGAMSRFDEWLARYRNTRGTGCVEAFCAFDTGHDLSPRFWHVPDTPHLSDARLFSPESPVLPFLAPDLTANAYAQRIYLARIAEELGHSSASDWLEKASQSRQSLFSYCYDEADGMFYDLDRSGCMVRIQSDVLLRVLACEVGDRAFFDAALKRYLLNTSKFFSKYPLTSIAMDDPRFDPSSSHNSWAGPVNFLTLLRTAHAFEHHGRVVELTWLMYPIMSAMARMTRFPQTLNAWTGEEGYTDTYSPAILCVLDFVERMSGIMPTPEGLLWCTGLVPYPMDHGEEVAEETGYSRMVDGALLELVNTRHGCALWRDGELLLRFPYGTRAILNRRGELIGITGMLASDVEGSVQWSGREYPLRIKGNETQRLEGGSFVTVLDIGLVTPAYR
ncbi:MGH1-like glycoside hydrolase domain-containing protein [Paenibacillus protaetiae]|uniref:Mannosylglycerate hydrolase MGH1-like glycoside hydrolase domain-containing protein n=1 Tax=Paenibacillus protaetiae TaxID=2509456 RepID=A0A4P6ES54_9BACL|nr:hypothetical protein [Paenibacillus protaetiae]QAY65265.1 hypothetical protein ET464_01580 [Paenibacillus protaetiae]